MSTRKCTSCKKELPLEEFVAKNDRGTVHSRKCKPCTYAVRQKNASATPQNYLTRLFGQLKHGSGRRDLNASIDRIDPDIDYLAHNIQLVCARANAMKHVLKEDELYWWAKNIVESKEND